ncbi:MAG TPA: methylated-DNA--[protein]-cysteine S-methyltransferase [Dongiaceae bacterium]|nr:methylated-DNA--[protein]-cysteine S-methyltransferase [Dongiaceae bacterium]
MNSSHFSTRYGTGIVYAVDRGIVKVEIPDLSRVDSAHHSMPSGFEPSELTAHAAHMLQRYFDGERIDFSDTPVVLEGMTPFRQKVLNFIRILKFGEVCSYGLVADECGSPHAARAVGGALAANPVPVIIPCHRVVAADGGLTGYSAPGGECTKKALLKMEGVNFKGVQVVTNQLVMHRSSSR